MLIYLKQSAIIKHSIAGLRYFLILIISVVSLSAAAQKRIINGLVLDSATYAPVTNAYITNTATNKTATTNSKGLFTLSVALNNMLFFTATNYHFDTLRYNNMLQSDTIIIYLAPLAHSLPDVTVTAKGYSRYQADSMKRREEFLSDIGNPKRTTVSNANSGAGIGLNLDFFSKREKNKRRAYKLFDEHEKDTYIRYRFSPEVVSGYTGFHGDTLQHFMQLYTPGYEWLRTHTADEDILYYINDKLRSFYNRKENH